ncbi:MAG TPA: hypothetical protein VNT53_04495 [Pseudolysinimonas sp.]|nr:hypothetical protein [Pseudolysinimonas sp.]
MRKYKRTAAGIAILGLSMVMAALGAGAANAAVPTSAGLVAGPPVAGPDESCWYAVDTGQGLCVKTGQDLVAAVADQKGVRMVVPDGAVVSGIKVNAGHEASLAPTVIQTTVALSTIYDNVSYGGGSYTMTASSNCASSAWGFADIAGIGWYGRVSSFKSYSGCTTAVFAGTNYTGASYGYVVNAPSVGSMNDRAKSWRVH